MGGAGGWWDAQRNEGLLWSDVVRHDQERLRAASPTAGRLGKGRAGLGPWWAERPAVDSGGPFSRAREAGY